MKIHTWCLPVALVLALQPSPAEGQGVLVDEGTFAITLGGQDVGTEEFAIRRAGFGLDATYFASGTIHLEIDGVASQLQPLLRATGADGTAVGYQIRSTGPESTEILVNLAPPRYVARITSSGGQEEREFRANPDTRIVDRQVAHQYYFLGGLRAGDAVTIIEPSGRRSLSLTVSSEQEEELTLTRATVVSRRVTFEAPPGPRTIWFDRQGRVLRVEIPDLGYVAQRTDLVG